MVPVAHPRAWFAAGAVLGLAGLPWAPCASGLSRSSLSLEEPDLTEALARAFPAADAFPRKVATWNEAERAKLAPRMRSREAPRLWSYREARRGGELLGRAVVGDVIGKTLPITWLVVLEPDNRVRAVEILHYRESHGGEVRREKWRAQFVGKQVGDPWKLGGDVRNIAGATLSCRALLDAVHDVALLAAEAFPSEARPAPARSNSGASPARSPGASPGASPGQRLDGAAPDAARAATVGPVEALARTQLVMGTLLELRAASSDRAAFDAACDAAFARVAELEARWSALRPGTEVAQLNAAEPGLWCPLGPSTVKLLLRARAIRQASGGAFTAEAGSLVELWRAAAREGREPSPAELEQARGAAAEGAIELDPAGLRARRLHPAARVDLGAIGKGAALDEVALLFRERGIRRALFDFGGQLRALEGPSEGRGWPVWVRDPRDGARGPLWELELERATLATSADDQRGLSSAGRALSHIVDPRSGRPASAHWTTCVLVSDDGAQEGRGGEQADAWSTALFVMERGACESAAKAQGFALLALDPDGTLWTSGPFPGRQCTP